MTTIEKKITEINTAIIQQIAKLRIQIPGEESKVWKKRLYGKCVMRDQMDKGDCLIEVETKEWVTADDSLNFIVAHVYSEGGQNNHIEHGYNHSKIGFDEYMRLVVLSNKKQAFNLVFEALKSINVSVISRVEDYNKVTKEYFVSKSDSWGVNPDYRGLIIEYKINIPYLDGPDYTVTD